MNTRGRHFLLEYWGCHAGTLDQLDVVEASMKKAALAAGATIVQSTFHRFAPQGVSGVVVVQESHLSIHTWPEYGYAAVDCFTCGDTAQEEAHAVLRAALQASRAEILIVNRGLSQQAHSMQVESHVIETTQQTTWQEISAPVYTLPSMQQRKDCI
ncbi:MAG: S-adenosylmethionine decarboxylase proenzyme [Gammaproteobacteria bacterium RIFCSPHIGHO2_12_FULL_45_9]|nr:MAG: S-adenosylmethionine decarboxylase proenzyme [Gammaproteobacteria bacterium RIFCSPHIGHO2_12_FULL_45_9]